MEMVRWYRTVGHIMCVPKISVLLFSNIMLLSKLRYFCLHFVPFSYTDSHKSICYFIKPKHAYLGDTNKSWLNQVPERLGRAIMLVMFQNVFRSNMTCSSASGWNTTQMLDSLTPKSARKFSMLFSICGLRQRNMSAMCQNDCHPLRNIPRQSVIYFQIVVN